VAEGLVGSEVELTIPGGSGDGDGAPALEEAQDAPARVMSASAVA
jgi:hypothetical protein